LHSKATSENHPNNHNITVAGFRRKKFESESGAFKIQRKLFPAGLIVQNRFTSLNYCALPKRG
jgi:hypothetical protein